MKKIIHNNILKQGFFWVTINIILTKFVWAAEVGGKTSELKLTNPLKAQSFSALVQAIAELAAKIGIPIAAIFIIYSGLMFVTARGSEEQLKKAKTTFMWTMIGTAILLGAWVIASAIVGTIESLK